MEATEVLRRSMAEFDRAEEEIGTVTQVSSGAKTSLDALARDPSQAKRLSPELAVSIAAQAIAALGAVLARMGEDSDRGRQKCQAGRRRTRRRGG